MSNVNRFAVKLVFAAAFVAAALRVLPGQRPRQIEVSGIPALNFDADEGFGYGAILALYSYDDNRVAYRWTLQPTMFLTTEGRRDYTLFFDAPSRAGHPWRITSFVGHEQQLAAPYYGVGNATAYDPAVEHGSTRYFYRYGRTRDRAAIDVQHPLWSPSFRVLLGGGASRETINLTPFDSGTTLIERDMHDVTPARQRTNFLRAGLTWDTRDREIGTQSGTWADAIVQRVDKSLGATMSYTRWTATVRQLSTTRRACDVREPPARAKTPLATRRSTRWARSRRRKSRKTAWAARARCVVFRRTATSAKASSCRTTSCAGARRTSISSVGRRRSC